MLRRIGVPALLVPLALLFFWPLVLHPDRVLYANNSDALAQHLPYKCFLARSWQEHGELPLWCPHSLGGAPFVHDPQVSIFYPPNLPLLLVPERLIGAAFSWLLVAQVLTSGLLAYAYGREEGLGYSGAFVTGAGFMLSGKWLLHLLPAGQTVVIGLAWLPLVALCFERALRRRSPGWAAAAGAALALIVLGTHPQWTLYAGLFLAAWTLSTALEGAHAWRAVGVALARWVGLGLLTAAVALALAAVQAAPTLEAIRQSCRHHVGQAHPAGNGTSLAETLGVWLGLVGPSLGSHPGWEYHAGLGMTWAMLLAAGCCLGGRRVWPRVAVFGGLFVFAVSGGLFLHSLPVFGLFRGPFRMLLLTCLPVAVLAGHATERLLAAGALARERRRLVLVMAAVAILGLLYTAARLWDIQEDRRLLRPYWLIAGLLVCALLVLAAWPGRMRAPLWCGILVADLLALSWPYVEVRQQKHVYRSSEMLAFLEARRTDHGRVLDTYTRPCLTPLGTGAPLALIHGLYPVRGYNPLDYYRYKNYLRILSDSEAPTVPLEIVDGFPVTHRRLLDLLGVRYLLQPWDRPPDGPGWRVACADPTAPVCFQYPYQGMHTLPPYTVYENELVMPRAFVVPRAALMPEGREAEALRATDFRRTVLVEGCDPAEFDAGPADSFRAACITAYEPNEVRIEVDGDSPGWLVLTDMWFPGWTCTVDGEERAIYPGNYLFRAVPVPAGGHDVRFRFDPGSYRFGRAITLLALAGLGLWSVVGVLGRIRPRRPCLVRAAPALSGQQARPLAVP